MSSSNLEPHPLKPALDLANSRRQDFDHDPGNDELARFVDPDGSFVVPVRVVETAQEIRVDLWHCPLWFVAICLTPVLAVAVWWWRGEFPRSAMFAIICLPVAATFALVFFKNQRIRAFGTFCVVDVANARLKLPRLGLSLSKRQIVRFVEFRGWRDTSPPSAPDTDIEWSRELSVIVKNGQGSFSRYQAVIGQGWPVSRIGQRLAEIFGVELTLVKE